MGLNERRAVREFQENRFPKLQQEIQAAAGFAVAIEVNWKQLAKEGHADSFERAWTEIYFKPVLEGLRAVGRDELGKDALKASLKKVEFRNSRGTYSPQAAITFEAGELTIDHDLINIDYTEDRTKYLIEMLESSI